MKRFLSANPIESIIKEVVQARTQGGGGGEKKKKKPHPHNKKKQN